MSDIKLLINGNEYTGWEDLSLSRSIEALAGAFSLKVSELVPLPIESGDKCELFLLDKKVLTGWVDSVTATADSGNHSIEISGRDLTGDLVDCAAKNESQEFTNIPFVKLIQAICAPFQIETLIIEPEGGFDPFKKFALMQETAWEAIERACRLRGVFAGTTPDGVLIIQEYGLGRAASGFKLGDNLLSASATFDLKDRFSEIKVYGQQPGDDDSDEKTAASVQGVARDPNIKRYRPLIVMAESQVNNKVAQLRAEWEVAVRAARGTVISCEVQGWEQAPGRLWVINEIANFDAPALGVKNDLLIKEVEYKSSNSGTTTAFTLTRADAYKKQPDLDEDKATGLKKGKGDDGTVLVWKDNPE